MSYIWGFAVPFLLPCMGLHGNEGNRSYLTPRHCWSLLCLLSMQTTVRLNNVLHCVCLNSKFTWLTFFLKSIGIHFWFRIQYLEFDKNVLNFHITLSSKLLSFSLWSVCNGVGGGGFLGFGGPWRLCFASIFCRIHAILEGLSFSVIPGILRSWCNIANRVDIHTLWQVSTK